MIDLHSHILRGIDDGARTMEESIEIARAALADGITAIAGTPHVRDDWPTDAGVMEYRVAELRAELQQQGIALDVRQGGEIAVDWLGKLPVETLRRFGLGGNPRYLLVETPYYGWPLGLADRLFALRAEGITPVLAHPERNAEVQAHPGPPRPARRVRRARPGDGGVGGRADRHARPGVRPPARSATGWRTCSRATPTTRRCARSGWPRPRRPSAAARSASG